MRKASLSLLALFGIAASIGAQPLVVQSYMSDEAPKNAFAALVAEFQKQNPAIKVTVNTVAHEQFKTQLVNYLTAKDAPDVLTWFAGFRMQQYAMKGLLEPLPESTFPGGSFVKEFPAAFKPAASYNSKIYFMPQSWYWWAVYYNKDVFAQYKLSVPKTWDEFLSVCETLKQNGVAPISIGAKDTWTAGGWFDYMNVAVNGGVAHQKLTGGTVSYTDPSVLKTFGYIADLAKKGYILENAASYSWQEAVTPLVEGNAGMYLMGQFIMDSVPADKKASIDFFSFPKVGRPDYGVDTPTDGFMIPAKAKNKAAAKKFIAFIATKQAQELMNKPLGRLSANFTVPVPNAEAERGLAMVKGAAFAAQFYDRDAPEEMAAKGMNAIVDILQAPDGYKDTLSALDKERVRIYADLK
ncbi:MAG: ABC transporter substrate-binding protein [Rectinemataceae bacterium]